MSNVPRDRKKSNFTSVGEIPSGATFDFVYNGTNYKISVDDMVAAFGTIGSISQVGDPTAVPILDTDGTEHFIRNFEAGSGILASLSVEDGLAVIHNFSAGDNGVPILIDLTEASPVVRNLVAGDGVSIATSGDSDNDIEISSSQTYEAGSGIAISSVDEALTISHNFTADDTGTPILIDETEDSPIISSLEAGTDIDISATDGLITIAFDGEIPTVIGNVTVVNEMTDFPDPVLGVITLEADTAYQVGANLSTSDRFVFSSNTVVYGTDSAVSSIEYTESNVMFTGVDVSSKVTLLTLAAPNGTLFDVSDSTGLAIFQFVNATVSECDIVGTFDSIFGMQITDVAFNSILSGGITFEGTPSVFIGTRNIFNLASGTMFDLGTTVFSGGFSLETSFYFGSAGTTFMSGLADSGNLGAGATGVLFNCRYLAFDTILDTISESDSFWTFTANDQVPDSITSILAVNAGTDVIIATQDTPVIIGATWLLSHESRFSGSAAGRFTYTGKGGHVGLTASISAHMAAAGDKDCTFYIYLNGIVETNSSVQRTLTVDPGSLSLVWQLDLETDDYIEVFAENNDDTTNITISKAIISING